MSDDGIGRTDQQQEDAARETLMKRAHDIGYDHGKAAGSWVFDGTATIAHYRNVLIMLKKGDPEIYDLLPSPDLGGEWADNYSGWDLARDLGLEDLDDDYADACEEYEMGFSEGVEAEVTWVARYHLA